MGNIFSCCDRSATKSSATATGVDNRTFTDIDIARHEAPKDIDQDSNHTEIQPEERYRPPPTRNHQGTQKKIVEAVWDYGDESVEDGELQFKKGDRMEIIKSDEDWWLAKKMDTGEEGYIPSNFVQVVDYNNPLIYPWYHGKITRVMADKRLKEETNDIGTFLIRESSDPECAHALSILTDDREHNNRRVVKHYRIRYSSGEYYITATRTFNSLVELINSYTDNSAGLCCELTVACPKVRPQIYDLCKSTQKDPVIPIEDISFVELLAEGNFGEVWKGKYKDRIDIAIKKLKEGSMPAAKFLDEAKVMKTLRHERLVALLAVCSDNETHYIITELLRGSLLDFLRTSPKQHISNLLVIASQIAEGMAYMESQNYIHRDLAARNVLMVDDYNVQIGDFGLSRMVPDEDDRMYIPKKDVKFPIKWTAPEAISDLIFTSKSDVWAYGILLVELTSQGQSPYKCVGTNGLRNSQLAAWLSTGNRHPKPKDCPVELYDLMLQCWDKIPQDRPSFSLIVSELEEIIEKIKDLDPGYWD